MLSINTNISSLVAQHSMKSATQLLNQAVERMTTGYKINHAKDNAANYSIATNLTTKINSYMVAEENCAMGLDLLATANGSLDLISDKLTRLRDLATQAGNGTYGVQSLNAINAEANALVDEINRLYSTAEYNGRKLFETAATPAVATFAMTRAATPSTGFIKQISQRNTDSMTTLESVSDSATISSGTYSISTAEELEKLATMTNNGQVTGGEFVLANDIDLSAYSNWTPIGNGDNMFVADFDGNGHVISNVTVTMEINSDAIAGLFGVVCGNLKNLGVENVDITGHYTGGLAGFFMGDGTGKQLTITNCYTTGDVEAYRGSASDGAQAGGLLGFTGQAFPIIENCWSSVNVTSDWNSSGLVGIAFYDLATIKNCYASGNITGENASGIIYAMQVGGGADIGIPGVTGSIIDSGFTGTLTTTSGNTPVAIAYAQQSELANSGEISGCYFDVTKNPTAVAFDIPEETGVTIPTTSEVAKTTAQIQTMIPTLYSYSSPATGGSGGSTGTDSGAGTGGAGGASLGNGFITLQIGTSSNSNSQIGFEISFSLGNIDDLRMIGVDTTTDYLSRLDNMLATVNAKQTEFGAVENRLESALESIGVNIENLTSSLSTIRDADIAEVSSEYIRQQILQQASATLMATANQSPSIALQLI